MKDKSLKTYKILASQNSTHNELHFLAAKSTTFNWTKDYQHISQTESLAQVTQTFAEKIMETSTLKSNPLII